MRRSGRLWRRRLAALAGLLMLIGCGVPTPYQPISGGEGYTEQALERDRYRVAFFGNSLTTRETVENYLLYRAAEVTVAMGYDYFVIVDSETERRTVYQSTFSGVTGSSSRRGGGVFFHGLGTGTSRPYDSYSAYANVIMRTGDKPRDDANAYDARAVLERLGPTVKRGPES